MTKKMKITPKMKMTTKMKTTPKMKNWCRYYQHKSVHDFEVSWGAYETSNMGKAAAPGEVKKKVLAVCKHIM